MVPVNPSLKQTPNSQLIIKYIFSSHLLRKVPPTESNHVQEKVHLFQEKSLLRKVPPKVVTHELRLVQIRKSWDT